MVDKALEVAGDVHKDRLNGQLSFFEKFEDQENFKKTFQDIPNIPEWPENQLLAHEKEMIGFYPASRGLKDTYSTCNATMQNLHGGDGIVRRHGAKANLRPPENEKMAIVYLNLISFREGGGWHGMPS
jgi:DNA polymerase III alpha subunit